MILAFGVALLVRAAVRAMAWIALIMLAVAVAIGWALLFVAVSVVRAIATYRRNHA